MNINGLVASFRGEKILIDKKSVKKVKTIKPKPVPRRIGRSKTTLVIDAITLAKVTESISVKGGLTPKLIAADTGLEMKDIYAATKALYNNKIAKRERLGVHGKAPYYSYQLIDDDSEPFNPKINFARDVHKELLNHEYATIDDLIFYVDSTKHLIKVAVEYLLSEEMVIQEKVDSEFCLKHQYKAVK